MFRPDEDGVHDGDGGGHVLRLSLSYSLDVSTKDNFKGAIFGGVGALRMGMRGGELVQNVGKIMVQGGGTFGTFMAIGTGIRC